MPGAWWKAMGNPSRPSLCSTWLLVICNHLDLGFGCSLVRECVERLDMPRERTTESVICVPPRRRHEANADSQLQHLNVKVDLARSCLE
jgi:hypothetical protein